MEITAELGSQIARRVQDLLGYPINLVNAAGLIVGSSDPDLIGRRDGAAIEVLSTRSPQEVSLRVVDRGKGPQPAVHLPLAVYGEVVGVVGILGDPSSVWHYGELVKTLAELFLEQALRMEQVGAERRLHEGLLREMVQVQDQPSTDLVHQAGILGQDLTARRLFAVLIPGAGQGEVLPHQADDIAGTLAAQLQAAGVARGHSLVGALSPGQVAACVASDPEIDRLVRQALSVTLERARQKYGLIFVAGISRLRPGAFSRSYAEARGAARTAAREAVGPVVAHISELGVQGVVPFIQSPVRADLSRQVLGRVLQHRSGAEILNTVKTYLLCNGSMRAAAGELHLHRNTVQYRVRQFGNLTGIRLSRFDEAALCWLAILIHQFDG